MANGPAAKAGIRRGDKILKVNDEEISSTSHLINYVALQQPNQPVNILIEREEQSLELQVVVGERKVQNSDKQFIPLPE